MLQQTVQRETVETSAKIAQSTMKPTDNALAVALSLSLSLSLELFWFHSHCKHEFTAMLGSARKAGLIWSYAKAKPSLNKVMYIVLSGLNSFLELSWLLVAILFLWLLGFGFLALASKMISNIISDIILIFWSGCLTHHRDRLSFWNHSPANSQIFCE